MRHLLSHPLQTQGMYTARCQCGLDVWGRSLPILWRHHDLHLRHVREAAR